MPTDDDAAKITTFFDTALSNADYNDLKSFASDLGVDIPQAATKDDLIALIMQADAPTEKASKRDGVLSYAAEWHAVSIGFYAGLTDGFRFDGLSKRALENPDVRAEPHYAKGGYVLGVAARLSFVAVGGFAAGARFF